MSVISAAAVTGAMDDLLDWLKIWREDGENDAEVLLILLEDKIEDIRKAAWLGWY